MKLRNNQEKWGIAVTGITPTPKIGKMQSAQCHLCKMARETRVESADGLVAETHGHIKSAGSKEMATTVTAAYHFIWRHLCERMHCCAKVTKQAQVCHT